MDREHTDDYAPCSGATDFLTDIGQGRRTHRGLQISVQGLCYVQMADGMHWMTWLDSPVPLEQHLDLWSAILRASFDNVGGTIGKPDSFFDGRSLGRRLEISKLVGDLVSIYERFPKDEYKSTYKH